MERQMPTECTPDSFGFEAVEGREVVATFDGGAISSNAGALLLGATDRAINMMDRFATFRDERRPELIEHKVVTLVGQRVFGIALGYEDLNDHDELRHDPLMARHGRCQCSSLSSALSSAVSEAVFIAFAVSTSPLR
jgi:Transposase DDE domain group 1